VSLGDGLDLPKVSLRFRTDSNLLVFPELESAE